MTIKSGNFDSFVQFVTENSLGACNFYLMPDLLSLWLHHLANEERFFSLLDTDEKNPSALPMRYIGKRTCEALPGGDIWRSGFLFSVDKRVNYEKYVDYLYNIRKKWDVIEFIHLSQDVLNKLTACVVQRGLLFVKKQRYLSRVLPVSGDFSAYEESPYMKKLVKSMISKKKQFAKKYGVDLKHTIHRDNDTTHQIEEVLRISCRSWKAKQNTHMGSEQKRDYYKEMWSVIAKREMGEIHLLWHDNKAIAFALVAYWGDEAYILKTSFDEDYKPYYVGSIIQHLALQHIFNELRAKKIDFLSDYQNCQLFCSDTEEYTTILLFNRSWQSRIRFIIEQYGKTFVKKILKKEEKD